ncbi:hypothetical protein ACQUQU_02210 [Thalassolituus sp. LLYu03]|uniref:hypothetical protein n=1 Tax=Thalassolituus sp. LLYu03 TaxID=3421656 RepID=UPI003D2B9E0B
MRKLSLTLPAIVASLALSSAATADDTDQRLDYLSQQFSATETHAAYWQNGWFGLFAGVTAVNGIAYTQTEGEHNKYDRVVGFTTSFLGAADMLMNPMKTHEFSRQLSAMPDGSASERQAKLAQAEAWLHQAAERERYERSFLNHALSGVVNGLAGLAVAYDDKRPDDGWVTFLTGMITSEIKIYTSPTTMTETEAAYNSGKFSATAAMSEQPRWQVAAFGPVLSASYRF